MKLKKKIFSVIIAVLMLANLVMPTMAQTITSNTFSGTVALDGSTKQTADLSNIDIKIYSLAVAYTDPTSGQNDYSDTYVSTVTTNKNGAFSFTKPSVYYKIEIDLSSLPTGYGVDKYRCIYENGQSNDTFTLYPIHNAEMVMETVYDAPEVVFTASNGQRIYRDYEINLSNESTRSASSPNVDILATTQATFAGNISGNEQYSFSKTFDLSNLSSLEKVGFYANTKMITEAEKIDKYCDIMIARDFVNGECLNYVIDEISDYTNEHARTLNYSTEAKVAQIFSVPTTSEFPNYVENAFFRIHYEDGLPASVANAIASAFMTYKNHLSSWGFELPIVDAQHNVATGNGKYNVYVTAASSTSGAGVAGTTFEAERVSGQKYSTYIYIYNVYEDTDISDGITGTVPASTLAHEYFHAVQAAYNFSALAQESLWFIESCASWYGDIYMGTGESISNHIYGFFINKGNLKSIYYTQENASYLKYGKATFPLTIDIAYGGYVTIRKIWEQLRSKNIYTFAELKTAVDAGLIANNRNSSFNDVFKTFSLYNSDPNYFYSSKIPIENEDEGTQWDWANHSYMSGYVNQESLKYSTIYLEISPTLSGYTYTVSGTITMSNSFSNGDISVIKVCKLSNGTCTYTYVSPVGNTFPISESELGGNSAKEIYYVIINTSSSANTVNTYYSRIEN